MKNVLDHRILIPKSPEIIWQYISNLANNSNWQTDCQTVSFLNTNHTGVGVRWRYTTTSGHDQVAETTAWYEGLGYEYIFVDGVPFEENRGRIRLQEIAEGTVVQWTFSYDTKGVLGGVRNTLSLRRQLNGIMMDSLRMLWRKLNQGSGGEPPREAKSLLQAAPDYAQRARYKPRHPSVIAEQEAANAATIPAVPVVNSILVEPPVADEDTRPSIAVSVPASLPEPDFVARIDEVPVLTDDRPTAQGLQTSANITLPPVTETPLETPAPTQSELREWMRFAPPEKPASEPPPLEPLPTPPEPVAPVMVPELPVVIIEKEPVAAPGEPTPTSESVISPEVTTPAPTPVTPLEPISREKLAKIDTREISVFDLFGLPKPSETQQMQAVKLPPEPAATPAGFIAAPLIGRVGLRFQLRRRRVKLRRPL
ncbi:MAG TPA: SRPBCC family protein [Phototrophicaceae bacterium]|nr:SRPBCC family protein [Phototrophicaceae bacterium]